MRVTILSSAVLGTLLGLAPALFLGFSVGFVLGCKGGLLCTEPCASLTSLCPCHLPGCLVGYPGQLRLAFPRVCGLPQSQRRSGFGRWVLG